MPDKCSRDFVAGRAAAGTAAGGFAGGAGLGGCAAAARVGERPEPAGGPLPKQRHL